MRGSVWLLWWCLACTWRGLGVILRESNAHALRIHKTKAKKQTLSLTHKKKNTNGNTQRICSPYTQKKPLTTYVVRLLWTFLRGVWGKLALSYIRIPPQNFLLNIRHAFCHSISTIGCLFSPSTI